MRSVASQKYIWLPRHHHIEEGEWEPIWYLEYHSVTRYHSVFTSFLQLPIDLGPQFLHMFSGLLLYQSTITWKVFSQTLYK